MTTHDTDDTAELRHQVKQQAVAITQALAHLEQAHQALHLGNERLAMRMIANAMEALA